MSANKHHPERQEGEVFLRNTANPEAKDGERLGKIAYDIRGESITGLYPVFGKSAKMPIWNAAHPDYPTVDRAYSADEH